MVAGVRFELTTFAIYTRFTSYNPKLLSKKTGIFYRLYVLVAGVRFELTTFGL